MAAKNIKFLRPAFWYYPVIYNRLYTYLIHFVKEKILRILFFSGFFCWGNLPGSGKIFQNCHFFLDKRVLLWYKHNIFVGEEVLINFQGNHLVEILCIFYVYRFSDCNFAVIFCMEQEVLCFTWRKKLNKGSAFCGSFALIVRNRKGWGPCTALRKLDRRRQQLRGRGKTIWKSERSFAVSVRLEQSNERSRWRYGWCSAV